MIFIIYTWISCDGVVARCYVLMVNYCNRQNDFDPGTAPNRICVQSSVRRLVSHCRDLYSSQTRTGL